MKFIILISLLLSGVAFADQPIIAPEVNGNVDFYTNDGTAKKVFTLDGTLALPVFLVGATTKDELDTDNTVAAGYTMFHPKLVLNSPRVLTVDGTLVTTEPVTGTGSIVGSGSAYTLD